MRRIAVATRTEGETERLAEDVASVLGPGDLVALSGPLGAGKSVFARALVRALSADSGLDVPSPTFALRLDYQTPRLALAHLDLYRLADPSELAEIGLDEAIADGAAVVEWPERGGAALPPVAAALRFEPIGETSRRVTLKLSEPFASRFGRARAIRAFLDRSGFAGATRAMLKGDASTRAYERVATNGLTAIVMNSPEKPEGPPVWRGRSYDAVAHRATTIGPFLDIGALLATAGLRVPLTLAEDRGLGLALLEDLGSEAIVAADGAPIVERYAAAVDALAEFHGAMWPRLVTAARGAIAAIPPYDADALLIEASLYADWFAKLDPRDRDAFLADWRALVASLPRDETTLVLRDLHSPNIIWQRHTSGVARLALIDFQDALIGHPAYDVASLLQDARVDLGEAVEARLKERYATRRRAFGPFDDQAFERAYAILGLQRATKVLGGFSRLAAVDAKTSYMRHLDHVAALVRRNLRAPFLSPMARWYLGADASDRVLEEATVR